MSPSSPSCRFPIRIYHGASGGRKSAVALALSIVVVDPDHPLHPALPKALGRHLSVGAGSLIGQGVVLLERLWSPFYELPDLQA